MTSNIKQPKIWRRPQIEHNLRYEDGLKYEDDLKYEENVKYEGDPKYEPHIHFTKPNLLQQTNQSYQPKHNKPKLPNQVSFKMSCAWYGSVPACFHYSC